MCRWCEDLFRYIYIFFSIHGNEGVFESSTNMISEKGWRYNV